MAQTVSRALLLLLFFYAGSVSASFLNYSQNPDVYPGLAAYVGDADGWPTPFHASAQNPPAPQDLFRSTESIRVAEMLDLKALDPKTDESNSLDPWNSTETLTWHAFWYDPAGTYIGFNLMEVAWSAIIAGQANDSEAVGFWTDLFIPETYGPLTSGLWQVHSYFEGTYQSSVNFTVPEPSVLLLMVAGLAGLGYRSRKCSS
ncbi:MAG: PEP-CTERM sorting domain-containing protein [Gammaproteobacteria bacterium]|nr:PEP-CTERM sorting domain-containing protein [Gammaproteobacteria bacterium]